MGCKRLIQIDPDGKIQRIADGRVKVFDVWQCIYCEEPYGGSWLWPECQTPYWVKVVFSDIVACTHTPPYPPAPNGVSFYLRQVSDDPCVWSNSGLDPNWYVTWGTHRLSGGVFWSELALTRIASGLYYFHNLIEAICQTKFVNELTCPPIMWEAGGGTGVVTDI